MKRAICPDFEELEHLLFAANTPFSPAQIHGLMVALLCVSLQPYQMSWQHLQQELGFLKDEKSYLCKSFHELFLATATDLYGPEEMVHLFLPDEYASLCERLDGLSQWCEGFLRGIKLASIKKEQWQKLPSLQEVVKDFIKFKEISLQDADEESEQKEKDYQQIIEFIRVAVLLVHAECAEQNVKKAEHFSREIH